MATGCAVCGKKDTKLLRCGRCASRAYCEYSRQNYILKVDLLPRFISNPRITRTLSCPATATFHTFHEALLVAFDWANTHLYDFEVCDHNDTRGREHRLVGGQTIFKITDFDTLDDPFGSANTPNRDISKIKLFNILDGPKTKGKTIYYNYDVDDGWEHVISCTGRANATPFFVCLEGEGHGCAKDVGGYPGWADLLRAYDTEHPTEDQKERMTWYETRASNKDPEGLRGEKKWRWNKDKINVALSELGLPLKHLPSSAPAKSSRSVLLISLEKQPFFDDMYSQLLAKLRSKAAVKEVTKVTNAIECLSRGPKEYEAVVLTDIGVMDDNNIAVQDKLVAYAKAGGTVIFGMLLISFADFDVLNTFFKNKWDVKWEVGSYHREMFKLNPQPRGNPIYTSPNTPNLKPKYSMKALQLCKTEPQDRIYVGSDGDQSPAVFAKYGGGNLAWIGDVNTETGTTELLLTMCGV